MVLKSKSSSLFSHLGVPVPNPKAPVPNPKGMNIFKEYINW